MSDNCDCKCGTETYVVSVTPISTDPREVVRGDIDDSFDSVRPVACVLHADWCSHRPTKATMTVGAQAFRTPNGSARIFVEGKRDLSQYVYAEVTAEVITDFEAVPEKQHFQDDSTHRFASYTASFGTNTGGFVFTPRDAQDDDAYTKSAWPLSSYAVASDIGTTSYPWAPTEDFAWPFQPTPYLIDNKYVGCRLTVRCGYFSDAQDTEIASFMFPLSAHGNEVWSSNDVAVVLSNSFPETRVSIGCHWDDIADENDEAVVRCGLEVIASAAFTNDYSEDQPASRIDTAREFGFFTFPFEVPRSLFVDEDSEADPKAFAPYRYCGVEADASAVEVPQRFTTATQSWDGGDSVPLTAHGVTLRVTCAADHANVFIDTDETEDVDTVPAAIQRSGDSRAGPVTDDDPYFARRPDIMDRVLNTVANADSWHASHFVQRGSPLAERNAIHHLHLEFVQAERPPASPFDLPLSQSPSEFPAAILWGGQRDWNYPQSEFGLIFTENWDPLEDKGPRFYFETYTDEVAFGLIGSDEPGSPPPMWFWNGISGEHELTPFVGDKRLFPNSYHVHYDSVRNTFSYEIEEPPFSEIESAGIYDDGKAYNLGNFVGPFPSDLWELHEAKECPVRKTDYRVSWSVETFVQLWATTSWNGENYFNGPLDIPLEDSGMTTESHDAYARRTDGLFGGVGPWRSWDPAEGASITVRARLGMKFSVTNVRGYRRIRERREPGITNAFNVTSYYYDATGELRVAGDHECEDVACTESVMEFKIPLELSDVESLSSGEEITKELLVGQLRVYDEELEQEVEPGEMVYRTVKVRLSKEGE